MSAAPLIAVVDDDAAILSGVSSLLRSAGYLVELHDSAEEFLLTLARAQPQCLLTDVQMPGMNGLELQKWMHERHPSLPVLIMTAFPDEAMRQRALTAGAIGYLSKPFDADELLQCVEAALAR